MADLEICSACGASLPANAAAGICAACQLQKRLATTVSQEPAFQEPVHQEPVHQEPVHQEPVHQEPVHQEPTAQELPVAGQPFGPYRIVRMLGKGGMGAVFEAQHAESGRFVALKVLNHKLELPILQQRFLREGRLAASINHPHNVYIYGTEEIAGTPVIAMELVRGGTLQDRVQRSGSLPVGEAVDLVLQIISGLEAAESAGVLHRDVKPSNCFLDTDGTVKIGDFGLSISTSPRAETNLTQSGVFLGTPAYSSPEQLRGDDLDVRSDIYSVGVTLYYLLTGRTPFEANQLVQFLATVLERPAPSPTVHRPDLPAGLARVVLRCLAKQRANRFKSYHELRQALLPYRSEAPTPATLGFRVLASGIDTVALFVIAALLPLIWVRDYPTWHAHFDSLTSPGPQVDSTLTRLGMIGIVLHIAYFAVGEGVWGVSVGKAICRLRVLGHDRELPGIPRAMLRATLFLSAGWLPVWLYYAYDPEAARAAFADSDWSLLLTSLVASLSLFASARRPNGFAGLHELASGTRVIGAPFLETRPVLELSEEPLPEMRDQQRLGPYHVLGTLEAGESHEVILGYDTRLLRKVWIRTTSGAAGTPPVHLRDLARIGRLRWLNGAHRPEQSWDAYEAPSGKPLVNLLGEPQPWSAVRFWLLDLAQELIAGLSDGSMVSNLALDRVWITADGRVKLLDFPAPGLSRELRDSSPATAPPDTCAASNFLKRVAIAGLQGKLVTAEEAESCELGIPLPLSARKVVEELGQQQEAPIPVAQLKDLTQRPATVSREKRIGVLAASLLLPLAVSALTVSSVFTERQFLIKHPNVGRLSGYLSYYKSLDVQSPLRADVEAYIAHEFRETIRDPAIWSDRIISGFFTTHDRRQLVDMADAHAELTQDQLSALRTRLTGAQSVIDELGWRPNEGIYSSPQDTFAYLLSVMLGIGVVVPSLLSALLFGNSLLLRGLDIAVVTNRGRPASRWRVLGRNAALWCFVGIGLGMLWFLATLGRPRFFLIYLILYGLVRLFTAPRGLQDILAGTRLVPR